MKTSRQKTMPFKTVKKKMETKPMSDFNKDKEEGALTFDRGWKWSFSTLKLIEFSLGVVGETPSLN